MKRIMTLIVFCAAVFSLPSWANSPVHGLIQVQSDFSFDETIKRFIARTVRNGLTVMNNVDHHKNALNVGLQLRPTRLIYFGSPKVGTAFMQCSQSAGIDLPLKALITQTANGQVWLSYNNLKYIEARHSLQACALPIDKIASNLQSIVTYATKRPSTTITATK